MLIYFSIFILPLIALFSKVSVDQKLRKILLVIFGVFLIIIIGFRHGVGGDWHNYINQYAHLKNYLVFDRDFGYALIHWFSLNYLNGIYSTNLISAFIFVYGLIRFCSTLPLPWLAIAISIPYIVIVVGMGYTRQSIALGFIFLALLKLARENNISFYLLVILASLFHQTAIVVSVVGIFTGIIRKNLSVLSFIFIFFVLSLATTYLLLDRLDIFIQHYIEKQEFQSRGALFRILMGVLASVAFFIYRKEFKHQYPKDYLIWFLFGTGVVSLFALSFFASSAADRLAIYLLPLQLVVFSRLPVLIKDAHNKALVIIIIISVYAFSLIVWLFFGLNSHYWVPYKNILFAM